MTQPPPHHTPGTSAGPRTCGPRLRLLAGALLLLTACADPGRQSLLDRAPDRRIADLTRIEPDAEDGWGEFTEGGWLHQAEWIDERWLVPTTLAHATLQLPAATAYDRTLRFSARELDERGPLEVTVSLNGVELETVEVDGSLREFELDAPAPLWLRGQNELRLDLARPEDDHPHVGIGAISYGGHLDGDRRAARELRLEHDESVSYVLAERPGSRLHLRSRRASSGELELTLREVDARNGRRARDAQVHESYAGADLRGGVTIPLPGDLGVLAELELTWHSNGGSPIELSRLEVLPPEDELQDPRPRLIVFLSVDTLSARHMSLYGYSRPTTPALERLAEESVVFEQCVANSSWTVPSYLSQFTGLLPEASRVDSTDWSPTTTAWDRFQLAPSRTSLAELMRAAGYRTVAIVDNHWLTQIHGVRQGFDSFDAQPARINITDTAGGMQLVFERALEVLDRWDTRRPLFLFLQVLDVHGPYVTVPPWRGRLASEELGPLVPVVGNYNEAVGTVQQYLVEAELRPEDPIPEAVHVNPLHDAYDEKVLELDSRLERLIEELERRGLFEQALFVLSADHGESTLDGGFYFRHKSVHSSTTHVPLLMRLPASRQGGRRVEGVVQLLDLYPTLAEFAGLEPSLLDVHGQSLVPALEGRALRSRPAVIEVDYLGQRSVVHDGWKLIVNRPWKATRLDTLLTLPRYWRQFREFAPEAATELAGQHGLDAPPPYDVARFEQFERRNRNLREAFKAYLEQRGPDFELYDLRADPNEADNLADRHPERVVELSQLLSVAAAESDFARAEVAQDAVEVELDESARRELVRLGYLDEDAGDEQDGPRR